MPRYRLDLSYNGSEFYGWAKQINRRTVQQELELSLSKVLPKMWGKNIQTIVAGRTDAKVHAKHQVVHFDYLDDLDLDKFLYSINCVLPKDIVVYNANQVAADFSARFWATSREYKYRICDNSQYRDPINRDNVFWYNHQLNVDIMNQSIRPLIGLNDFSAFVKPRTGQTSIRDLQKFEFVRVSNNQNLKDCGLIVATLKADAFAYNMVRSLIGASLLVGTGKRKVDWIKDKLCEKTREAATGPIDAKGLTLEAINYDLSDEEAREREMQIKNRRKDVTELY